MQLLYTEGKLYAGEFQVIQKFGSCPGQEMAKMSGSGIFIIFVLGACWFKIDFTKRSVKLLKDMIPTTSVCEMD